MGKPLNKHPDDSFPMGLNLEDRLSRRSDPPEVLSSVTVAWDATDESDKLFVFGTAYINQTDVVQHRDYPTVPAYCGLAFPCSGGTDGQDYILEGKAVTSQGKTLAETFTIKVRRRA